MNMESPATVAASLKPFIWPTHAYSILVIEAFQRALKPNWVPAQALPPIRESLPPLELPPFPTFTPDSPTRSTQSYRSKVEEFTLRWESLMQYHQLRQSIPTEFRNEPVMAWDPFRFPDSPTAPGLPDPVLVACPAPQVLDMLTMSATALFLRPAYLKTADSTTTLTYINAPWITLLHPLISIQAHYPVMDFPNLPLPLAYGKTATVRQGIRQINAAFELAKAINPSATIWVPVTQDPNHLPVDAY